MHGADHSAEQGTALAPFPHLWLFEMLCSVFTLKVSLFFKSKITCNFIQCTFFLSVCHLTLSLTLLSSLRYFKSMWKAGTTFTAKKLYGAALQWLHGA